eukprot:1095313-Rhodomonas_salina.3
MPGVVLAWGRVSVRTRRERTLGRHASYGVLETPVVREASIGATSLHASYVMSGTGLVWSITWLYRARWTCTNLLRCDATELLHQHLHSILAIAHPCLPGSSPPTVLRGSSADVGYAATRRSTLPLCTRRQDQLHFARRPGISLRACYAMSGTDVALAGCDGQQCVSARARYHGSRR